MLDRAIREYPAEEQPPGSWWLPASYGGSAPTPEEAKRLDHEELQRRAAAAGPPAPEPGSPSRQGIRRSDDSSICRQIAQSIDRSSSCQPRVSLVGSITATMRSRSASEANSTVILPLLRPRSTLTRVS